MQNSLCVYIKKRKVNIRVHFKSCKELFEQISYSSENNGIIYRKTSNIRRTLLGNKIVDHSDVVGASPAGATPTTSSFLT